MKFQFLAYVALFASINAFSAESSKEEVICGKLTRPGDGDIFSIKNSADEYFVRYSDDNFADSLVHALDMEYCVGGVVGKDKFINITKVLGEPSVRCGTLTFEVTEGQSQVWLEVPVEENPSSVKVHVLITETGNQKLDLKNSSILENTLPYENSVCVKGPLIEDPLDGRPSGSRRYAMIVQTVQSAQ